MKHTMPFRHRANCRACRPSYRPRLEFLEDRLPLGDALLGALLGSSLIAPHLLDKFSALDSSADNSHDQGLLLTFLAKPRRQNPPVVHTTSADDAIETLRSHAAASYGNSETASNATRLPPPDWAILSGVGNSPARLMYPDLWASDAAAYLGQSAGGAFFGNQTSDASWSAILGALTQSHSPEMARATATHSSARSAFSAISAVSRGAIHTSSVGANSSVIRQNYGQMPLSFEANVGQADSSVHFLAHGSGYDLYLTGTEAVMVLSQKAADPVGRVSNPSGLDGPGCKPVLPTEGTTPSTVVRMQVVGGNPAPAAVGLDPLPDQVNYFLGNDPVQWHTHIPTFAKVEYQNVYPGINLDYYGREGQLEYDFVVASGADPRVIHLGFTGADQLSLNAQGDLVLRAGGQDFVQHKPLVYQEVNGSRQEIPSAFALTNKNAPLTKPPLNSQDVGFALGAYDTSRPLVIDPVLSYSTYLGGSGFDEGIGIAVDPTTGDILITGDTSSTNFPIANPLQPNYGGSVDAFVARLSADGTALVYSTYLGGSGNDFGAGIAVDPTMGDALVTGITNSTDFPTANPLQPNYGGGAENAFVARLSADGGALIYSTYLGGSGGDLGTGIAVDPTTGDALVTGLTYSLNFPTANPLQPHLAGTQNAFVARLSADGSALVYSTYLGGSDIDSGYGIAVDPTTGDALVVGGTNSGDFPETVHFGPPGRGAFVTALAPDGSALVYSAILYGGLGNAITVDPSTGDVLVTGVTDSTDFPTANPLQPNYGGGSHDAFVARLNADGSALVYSTYLGGSGDDYGVRIAVDPTTGDALVTGFTLSSDFPTANPLQPANQGSSNAFIARLSADGSALVYSTYLGGSNNDGGYGIAVNPTTGDALVTGRTSSPDFPTVNPLQPNYGGGFNAFVARISA